MNDYIMADDTVIVNFYSRVDNRVITNFDIVTNKCMGKNFGVVSNLYIFAKISESADENILTIDDGFCNIAWLLYTAQLLCYHFLIFGEQCRKRATGVRHTNEGSI